MKFFFRSREWFNARFGEHIQKIPVDAGFSCPNLDGTLSSDGCAYCNNKAFSPFYSDRADSIQTQIARGITFFKKRYKCSSFLAYFQNFSCTHAPVEVLRQRYLQATAHPGIKGIIIATRPDCISNDVLELLSETGKRTFTMLELGVESFCDESLEQTNRCHNTATSINTIKACKQIGIPVNIHLIMGLPAEKTDFPEQMATISSKLGVDMVKLHHLQILHGSTLAESFQNDMQTIQLYCLDEYISILCRFIAHLSPAIAIDRFINRVPLQQLVAPRLNIRNEAEFQNLLVQELAERRLWQGKLFSSGC